MSYDEKHLMEGITRKKVNNEFVYYYIDSGKPVTKKDLDRIHKLKIPPAWTDLWIAKDPDLPIQAIGKDVKGRKQYRYHQVHIEKAEIEKFTRMYNFIKAMPKLDKILAKHNDLPMYNKDRIISLMLQMVKDHQLRVGKEVYAKTNKSYGIASLRKKHVKIVNNQIYLKFKGKSNQRLHYTIKKELYIQSIKMLMKLEGDRLFQYIAIDDSGKEKIMKISDRDLNHYIQEHMGSEFTIKDFRTYGANIYFIQSLLSETKKRNPKNRKIIKKNIINAINSTARQLKHTGAVSKKSYVMSFMLELYQNDPSLFVKHKNDQDPTQFLLELLKQYKRHVIDE